MRQTAFLFSLLIALPLFADKPLFRNTAITAVGAGDLISQIESFDGWTAWSQPTTTARPMFCGGNGTAYDRGYAPAVVVMVWAEDGKIGRVKFLSPECSYDMEGNPVQWVEDVSQKESLRVLSAIIGRTANRGLRPPSNRP